MMRTSSYLFFIRTIVFLVQIAPFHSTQEKKKQLWFRIPGSLYFRTIWNDFSLAKCTWEYCYTPVRYILWLFWNKVSHTHTASLCTAVSPLLHARPPQGAVLLTSQNGPAEEANTEGGGEGGTFKAMLWVPLTHSAQFGCYCLRRHVLTKAAQFTVHASYYLANCK